MPVVGAAELGVNLAWGGRGSAGTLLQYLHSPVRPLELLACSPLNFQTTPLLNGCASFAVQVQAPYPKLSLHFSLSVLLHMPPKSHNMWDAAWIGCWSLFNDTSALLLIKIS